MINQVFKEYMEEINSQELNYQKILSKEKGVIRMRRKMLNIAAVLFVIVLLGTVSTQIYAQIKWNIEFKEYQSSPVGEAKGNLDEVRESDYAEVLNMDYVVQDGVSVKIDSILLTDDCLDAKLEFQFAEDKQVNSETFRYGFAVYDENNNIYTIFSRTHIGEKRDNTTPFIYKELGIKYNKKDIYAIQLSDSCSIEVDEVNEAKKTIINHINIRARDSFPQSKKLYIRIFDLGYDMYDMSSYKPEQHTLDTAESFDITDARWIFEIDVPDKFYERNTIQLKLANEIPGFEINKATLTETSLVLNFKSEAYTNLIMAGKDMKGNEFMEATKNMLNITDGEGKIYQDIVGGTREEDGYKMTLDAGKKDLEKGLFVNFTVDGEKYSSELVVK